LEKLVFKNPLNHNQININDFFQEMSFLANNLKNLRKLTISNFNLDNSCVPILVECVENLAQLYYLDISANRLELSQFVQKIMKRNNLRYLNLGYNQTQSNQFCENIA
jgi:Leucine-rich repeat (LRR) protein